MTAACADNELWHVLMDADDMKRMNVDQLGDAFRLSLIDASTLVWQAGMDGWRRLGSIADVEDVEEFEDLEDLEEDDETQSLWAPPPPPPPVAAPRRRTTSTYRGVASSFDQRELVAPVYSPPQPIYSRAYPSSEPAFAPAYPSPAPALATTYPSTASDYAPANPEPAYAAAFPAADPYAMPKRVVSLPDKIDFRRAPGSIRWGRWFAGMLIVTVGALGAYRQNLLRGAARSIGIESTYLAGEQRATAFVSANAPAPMKSVLTSLSLLPGPNAKAGAALSKSATATAALARETGPAAGFASHSTATAALPPCAAVAPAPEAKKETEIVKTVSFDSLPVLGRGARAAKTQAPEAAAEATPSRSLTAKAERAAASDDESSRPNKKRARKEAPEPVAKAKPKPEPKPKSAPVPRADDNPLKAAMRNVVASDTKKLAGRN